MKEVKVKFNHKKDTDFVTELRSRVDDYFKSRNLSPHANAHMIIKTIALFAITYIPFIIILTIQPPLWVMFLFVVLMGFGFAGIGFSIGHDALHGSYSANPKVNRLLGYSFNLIGANDYIWRIKHNQRHHTYTNIYEKDDDLDAGAYLRFSPSAPWKPTHQGQHITAIFMYAILSIGWIFFFDFEKLQKYNGNGSPNPDVKHPKNEVIKLIGFKVFYLLYMLVLPIILLPLSWWIVLTGFVIMHAVTGLTLSLIFQLAHIVEETAHPEPEMPSGLIDNAWAVHQMQTTANYSTDNSFLTWYVGGLNYQIEHHLFPNICSVHYPSISGIVEETARKYNIPYNVQPSFWKALASHFRLLKQFSYNPATLKPATVKA